MSELTNQFKLPTAFEVAKTAHFWLEDEKNSSAKSPNKLEESTLDSGATVEDIINKYRLVAHRNPVWIDVPEEPHHVAEILVATQNLTRHLFHLGEPVLNIKKLNDNAKLVITQNIHKDLGKSVQIILYKCTTGNSNINDYMLMKELSTEDCEKVSIELKLDNLINKCKENNENVLQILIGTVYYTEPKEGNSKPPVFLTRCIEVWSEECGVSYSSNQSITTWPVDIDETALKHYGAMLDPATEEIQNSRGDLKFQISVLSPNVSLPEYTYNYETNSYAHFFTRPKVYENRNNQKEAEDTFEKELSEVTELMKATKIIYRPSLNTTFADLSCIVCREKFESASKLIFHFIATYPFLHFKLQRQPYSNGNCALVVHLYPDENNDSLRMGNEMLKEVKEHFRKSKISTEARIILVRAMCDSQVFYGYGKLNRQFLEHYEKFGKHRLMCSECGMKAEDFPAYASGLISVENILNKKEINFPEKFFYTCFQTFILKSRVLNDYKTWNFDLDYEQQCEKIYIFLRVFIHTHSVLFKYDRMLFLANFCDMLENHASTIFHLKQEFYFLYRVDLQTRARDADGPQTALYTRDEFIHALFFANTRLQKANGTGIPELSGAVPKTIEARVQLLETLSRNLATTMKFRDLVATRDQLDYFHIPKCLYFGVN